MMDFEGKINFLQKNQQVQMGFTGGTHKDKAEVEPI